MTRIASVSSGTAGFLGSGKEIESGVYDMVNVAGAGVRQVACKEVVVAGRAQLNLAVRNPEV